MKILLLGFNVQETGFPLGLAYLKGYIEKNHSDVDVSIKEFSFGGRYSYETNKNVELQALSYIMLHKPDVVGFSCYIWSGEMAQHFARAIKKINPNIVTVLGGVEVSEKTLTQDVDFCIQEEGEIAFSQLVSYLKNECRIEDVPNVICWKDGKVVTNKVVEIENLDELVFPYKVMQDGSYKVVRLETARGCIFNCKFCHYAKPLFREFSLDYLRENIGYLFAHYEFSAITFLDANFNTNEERMFAILDIVKKCANGRALRLHMELRPELITPKMVERLESYPFTIKIELGLQSTHPDVLKAVGRPTNIGKVKDALLALNDSHIQYKIDLMYGLPQDTFFRFLGSARFLLENATKQKKLVAHHFMQLNNTELSQDTSLERITPTASSMVIKTSTQNVLDLYLTKLFIDQLNAELELFG